MAHLHKYKETTYFQDEDKDVVEYILKPSDESMLSLLPMELRYIIVNLVYVKYELQPLKFSTYDSFVDYLKLFDINKSEFDIKINNTIDIPSMKVNFIGMANISFKERPFNTLVIGKYNEDGCMRFHYRSNNNKISSLSIIPTAKNDSI